MSSHEKNARWRKAGIATVIAAVAIVFVGAMLIIPRIPAPRGESSPGIEAKAESFAKEVDSYLDAKQVAANEARLVRVTFPRDRPMNVFYAGDSLGFGFHASVESKAYRPLITAHLEKTVPVEEYRATKPNKDPLFQIGNIQSIPKSGIDLAIIELGTNDAGRTDLKLFREQYDDVLTRIEKGSPDAGIICAGAWGFPGTQGTDPYDRAISGVCAEHGGRYVDLTDAFMAKGSYGPAGKDTWVGESDNFHPNDKGHRRIADLILDRIILH